MSDINVRSSTQKIYVDPASSSVAVVNAGPIGPAGPGGDGSYPSGSVEYAYAEMITNMDISAVSSATSQVVLNPGAVDYDGTPSPNRNCLCFNDCNSAGSWWTVAHRFVGRGRVSRLLHSIDQLWSGRNGNWVSMSWRAKANANARPAQLQRPILDCWWNGSWQCSWIACQRASIPKNHKSLKGHE